MKSTFRSFLLLLVIALMPSCRKEEDTGKPAIVYLYTYGLVDDHLHGLAGDGNPFEIKVSDDLELSQMKMQIISPTGFHSHDGVSEEDLNLLERTFQSPNIGKWDTTVVYNLSAKEQTRNLIFDAPDSISGGWKVRVGLLDTGGNLTQEDYTLHVFNDDFPDILPDATIPVANEDGIVELALNETVQFDGDIVDVNDSLLYVECVVLKGSDTAQYHIWNNIGNWVFPMEQIVVDPFNETGSYLMHIRAVDMLGWKNWKQVRIEVSE